MNLKTFKNVWSMIVSEGPYTALRSLMHRASEKYQERKRGIHTAATIDLKELGFDNPLCREYGPTDYSVFRRLMKQVTIRPGEDVFLDLGSGMGRALIMAGEYPFHRIIGIEISAELNRTAEENIKQAAAHLRCRNIETVVTDARAFEIPDDVSIVYFNNSFHGEIFAGVLENLHRSVTRTPRHLELVCNVPLGSTHIEKQVSECGWLKKQKELVFPPHRRCFIYGTRVA